MLLWKAASLEFRLRGVREFVFPVNNPRSKACYLKSPLKQQSCSRYAYLFSGRLLNSLRRVLFPCMNSTIREKGVTVKTNTRNKSGTLIEIRKGFLLFLANVEYSFSSKLFSLFRS